MAFRLSAHSVVAIEKIRTRVFVAVALTSLTLCLSSTSAGKSPWVANKYLQDAQETQAIKRLADTRPFLGLLVVEGRENLVITSVVKETGAAKAGLRVGDEIVSIDGSPTRFRADLQTALSKNKPGDSVALRLLRDGKEVVKEVVLSSRPNAEPTTTLTPNQASRLGLKFAEEENRVYIDKVGSNTDAARKGLKPRDFLISINDHKIRSIQDIEDALADSKPGSVLLKIRRGDRTQLVNVGLTNDNDSLPLMITRSANRLSLVGDPAEVALARKLILQAMEQRGKHDTMQADRKGLEKLEAQSLPGNYLGQRDLMSDVDVREEQPKGENWPTARGTTNQSSDEPAVAALHNMAQSFIVPKPVEFRLNLWVARLANQPELDDKRFDLNGANLATTTAKMKALADAKDIFVEDVFRVKSVVGELAKAQVAKLEPVISGVSSGRSGKSFKYMNVAVGTTLSFKVDANLRLELKLDKSLVKESDKVLFEDADGQGDVMQMETVEMKLDTNIILQPESANADFVQVDDQYWMILVLAEPMGK